MEMDKIFSKSLEMIDRYFNEVSNVEFQKILNKVEGLGIEGPTFDEFLSILNDQSFGDSPEVALVDCNRVLVELVGYNIPSSSVTYHPPPSYTSTQKTKKDPEYVAGSFFCTKIAPCKRLSPFQLSNLSTLK